MPDMTKPIEPPKPKRGRPAIANPANQTLGRVRVTQLQIDAYTDASIVDDVSLSDWVRTTLDKAAKRKLKQ